MRYQKPPLTIPEQLKQLKLRGLVLDDEQRVADYFSTIGYFRLSSYFIPFADTSEGAALHTFLPDTRFDDVLSLYVFDRQLRLLIMEALERIEVAVRACWVNELSIATSDSHAYMSSEHFRSYPQHIKQLNKAATDLESSNEVFVTHYKRKYQQPELAPTWAMAETLTFGALSKWYSNTRDNKIKKCVADLFSIPTVEVMDGVLEGLTILRNVCAHHSRCWNRRYIKRMPYIKRLSTVLNIQVQMNKNGEESTQVDGHLYNSLVVIAHMMKTIQPNSLWDKRLADHINQLSQLQQKAMGFPEQWQKLEFWQVAAKGGDS